MRILYLNPIAQMGGAETALLQLLTSLHKAQPTWSLHLILGTPGPLAEKSEAQGISTSVLPFPTELAQSGDSALTTASASTQIRSLLSVLIEATEYRRQLRALVERINPDLIHTNGFKMHLLGIWSRPFSVPVIWHIHDYIRSRPLMSKLLRWHSSHCAAIIANSKSVQEDIHSICSNHPRVVTIYNAIDLERFSAIGPKLDLDAAAGLPPLPAPIVRIGLLATFAKWKGHKVFLKALSLLPRTLRFRGYIIGAPIYQTAGSQCTLAELHEEASRLGLTDRIGFTGFVEEPASAVRALDIIVHASTEPEPFGMVIVEGMACGKPVIASAASGAAEIFKHGQNILAYPIGDARELANHLETLVDRPSLRESMGAAARRCVETIFQGTRLASELNAIYSELTFPNVRQSEGSERTNIEDPQAAVL